ncbi:hypothetical protein NDR87_37075 [Nocardia sp. CDC159]|nr:hypothetical protein [Nocardia sp. CDC159]MCM6790941.1 hypothetical protein [Nocardia sp. CDC159]MCM6791987.1 hypothetical protein [Nocardia sp. CDC159]
MIDPAALNEDPAYPCYDGGRHTYSQSDDDARIECPRCGAEVLTEELTE